MAFAPIDRDRLLGAKQDFDRCAVWDLCNEGSDIGTRQISKRKKTVTWRVYLGGAADTWHVIRVPWYVRI